uniref:Glycerophosphocholine phosphodiesterase GPCPD1 n=1 Tax=Latimeria chalumnae TaxID=7897 RepID=H3BBZ7_LATCH
MTPTQVTFLLRGTTLPGEVFAICGSCNALGNWHPQEAVALLPNADCTLWTKTVILPGGVPAYYRYFRGLFLENKTSDGPCQVIVNKWETHHHPRFLIPSGVKHHRDDGKFGIQTLDGVEDVDSGWLTCQTEIRLRLHYSEKPPVSISKKKFKKSRFRVKLTFEGMEEEGDDDDQQSPTTCHKMIPTLDTSLISNNEYRSRHSQPECGYALHPDQWMEYSIQTMEPDNLELIFEFFEENMSETVVQGDALPGLVGTACLLSSTLMENGKSSGFVTLPIMSRNSRQTIGKVRVDYLVIKPILGYSCDMKASYVKYWRPRPTLDVGHRGGGNTSTTKLNKVRENTIASLRQAASHGAAFVEFDVHLSKDCVPVVYHDLTCCISMKKKMKNTSKIEKLELFEIPVKELTFEQLQLLKLVHAAALKSEAIKNCSQEDENEVDENQPFPSLQQVLEVVPETTGFNIEIKWLCQQKNGVWEGNLSTYFDMNMFLDIVLKCVLEKAGKRRIVFSSFDADVCTMIRQKQNKYPVLFLTQGYSEVYPELMDLRCRSTPIAMSFAQSENILGINVHTEDLLRNPVYIQEAKSKGLVIFCWGDDTNDAENRRRLRDYGAHGLIYDGIYDSMPEQPNIFQVEELENLKNELPEEALKKCICSGLAHYACTSTFCISGKGLVESGNAEDRKQE